MYKHEHNAAFEEFVERFPSNELLEKIVGPLERLPRKIVRSLNWRLLIKGPMSVYSDVGLANALKSGELRSSYNPFLRYGRKFPYVISRDRYIELQGGTEGIIERVRSRISDCVLGFACRRMEGQDLVNVEDFDPNVVYVFQHFRLADHRRGVDPNLAAVENELFHEFMAFVVKGAFNFPKSWWKIAADKHLGSIWLEPLPNAREILARRRAKFDIPGFVPADRE